jgi:hypothetical protein
MNQALGKTGKSPVFPQNSKEAVPKAEVLEQPHVNITIHPEREYCHKKRSLLRFFYSPGFTLETQQSPVTLGSRFRNGSGIQTRKPGPAGASRLWRNQQAAPVCRSASLRAYISGKLMDKRGVYWEKTTGGRPIIL